MKKLSVILLGAALMLSGCESSQQIGGVYMGGMLGSVFGSSIGGLMGGPRGADAGGALGMIIGGATGAVVTAPKDGRTKKQKSYDATDEYNRRVPRQAEVAAPAVPDGYRDLQIENLRFVDQNSNRTIDAGERAKLVFEIRNAGPTTVYNVTPVVGVTGTKKVMVSPTAIVASIAPGRSVRYTAELYGKPSLRRGMADFTISFAYGQYLYTVRSFQLQTGR